jgi:hypothetical protein
LVVWRSLPEGDLRAERQLKKDVVAGAAFSPDADTLPLEPPPEPPRRAQRTETDGLGKLLTGPER